MNKKIESVQHPLVKHCLHLRLNSDYRDSSHSLLLEGVKPILEVKEAIVKVLYTPLYQEMAMRLPGEKWEVSEAIIDKISGMRSPEGLIAEVSMPRTGSLEGARRVLALDGVSDPGNLGTLLRTALSFGWDSVCFLPLCCDPYNEKVLRSARGAHFKLNLIKASESELFAWVKASGAEPLYADIHGRSPGEFSPKETRLLILGNEAHGVSDTIREGAQAVSIPMKGDMESLNVAVAGGILLYLLQDAKVL